MTAIVGIIGAAVLFGLFTVLRPSDNGCAGQCPGCTHDGKCETKGVNR
jgi:hypothetical protein